VHLTRLTLTDFRCYAAVDLSLGPGVSTLIGQNGEGKTNLVEAAGYVATLGSHRVSSDAPLVRQGTERAIVRAAVSSAERDSLVELEINPGRANRARVNRVPVPRPRQVLGILRTVLFAPEDLALVKGDPDQRRRYLDELLVAAAPRYAAVRSDYERVVKQRTALLKSGRAHRLPEGALETWDDHLVRTGVELLAGRLGLTAALRPLVAKAYAAVSGEDGTAGINYRQRSVDSIEGETTDRKVLAARLRDALARVRFEELDRGVCLAGPHRDDLELTIGSLPARGYASHGESWSMALALRLAAYELLRTDGGDPVLLLDDVFAELDTARRDRLARLVAGAEQVLVTAAVPADVPDSLAGIRFDVAEGTVRRAG
jgi:DNA replication and repair protein RecF